MINYLPFIGNKNPADPKAAAQPGRAEMIDSVQPGCEGIDVENGENMSLINKSKKEV